MKLTQLPPRAWWGLATVAVLFGVSAALWSSGDPSVIVDPRPRHNPRVENGHAFDRAVVSLGEFKKLMLPPSTTVRRTAPAGEVVLRMEKRLAFGGHPRERLSIRDARHEMGCAVKPEGEILAVTSFGEWDSWIEGGRFMTLVADVPEGVELVPWVEPEGRGWSERWLGRPDYAKGRGWYGPASPPDGWAVVPATPDPAAAARAPRDDVPFLSSAEVMWHVGWVATFIGSFVTWAWGLASVTSQGRGRSATVGFGISCVGFFVGVCASLSLGVNEPERDMPWAGIGLPTVIGISAAQVIAGLFGVIILPRTASRRRTPTPLPPVPR